MGFKLSARSLERLTGVHPDLVSVMRLAIETSPIDFTVLEGRRTIQRQRELMASGATKTMNSRHLTGHAIDIAPLDGGAVSWAWPLYHKLAPVVKQAAVDVGVQIEWGGDWTSFKDGPHWQLPWAVYAADDMAPRAREFTGGAPEPAPEYVLRDDLIAARDALDRALSTLGA